MPKYTLYLYQEQQFDDPPKIVPWHIKVPDDVTWHSTRTFIKEVEVDIPDVEFLTAETLTKSAVAVLNKQKQDIQADCQLKLNQIEDRISQLTAITYKSEEDISL